jgi:hypothetical protein
MKEVTALFSIKEEPTKEKAETALKWYDTVKQEMVVLYGGKLDFEYKEDEYLVKMGAEERRKKGFSNSFRLLPKVVDVEIKNYNKIKKITNQKQIENWFNSSTFVNDIFITNKNEEGIVFEVSDNEIDDFCYQLERQGFRFRD